MIEYMSMQWISLNTNIVCVINILKFLYRVDVVNIVVIVYIINSGGTYV